MTKTMKVTDKEIIDELFEDSSSELSTNTLPCKLGDVVYSVCDANVCFNVRSCIVIDLKIVRCDVGPSGKAFITGEFRGGLVELDVNDFGKTLFLNPKEAWRVQAAKEIKNGE